MQKYNIFSSLYLLPVISHSRSSRQRLYLAPAAARKEDQTSPHTAWLPWSRLWHGRWMAPLAVRRWLSKTNESKAHQSEGETPLSSAGRLDGGGVSNLLQVWIYHRDWRECKWSQSAAARGLYGLQWAHCVCSACRGKQREPSFSLFFVSVLLKGNWRIQQLRCGT